MLDKKSEATLSFTSGCAGLSLPGISNKLDLKALSRFCVFGIRKEWAETITPEDLECSKTPPQITQY